MDIVEKRSCANCEQEFPIFADDLLFYENIKVPPPTWCPECRARRRLSFWTERNLFRKKEALQGREVFSSYPEQSPLKIYDRDYWWSDAWDPMDYARDFDPTRPFLEQLRELMLAVPFPSRSVRNMVRSDYCDQASDFKDSYLTFNGAGAENCMYGVNFYNMKNSLDFYMANACEFCYELFSVEKSYQSFFVSEAEECRNCWFMQDCENCSDCFGCVGLSSKQYYIWNEPYGKEEYQKKLQEFNLGSHRALSDLKKKFDEFRLRFPVKYAHAINNTNVIGEYVYHSKNSFYCYGGLTMENVRYSQILGMDTKDSYDYSNWGEKSELMYEVSICGDNCRNVRFSFDCWPACRDMEYNIACHTSSDLLGCVGLRNKQYCILNKQYAKEEYEVLKSKIVSQMKEMPYKDKEGRVYGYGEFFPPDFAPLAYNESVAQDYAPLRQEEAEKMGFVWREKDPREYQTTIKSDELTDDIREATESVLKEQIACADCGLAYRIILPELEFYKRFNLPLPRLCHRCRYKQRTKDRNLMRWRKGKCMCGGEKSQPQKGSGYEYKNFAKHFHGSEPCPNEFETAYAPDRSEILYCEKCYQSEVA